MNSGKLVKKWTVNVKNGTVSSDNGFICQIVKGQLFEIKRLPPGINTKQIKQYSNDAVNAFHNEKKAMRLRNQQNVTA
ncbi:MAG: hypothetical protein QM500_14645 [Methylococcales bacterium]